MVGEQILFCVVIALALTYTFTNGFQDGSSVCAAAVTSRAMSPPQAVRFVALCELAGALFGGSAVAISMQSITTHPANTALLPILVSALTAAISWNFITRRLRLPSSSTHALVGGIMGALYGEGGSEYINWGHATSLWQATGVMKVVMALFLSPLIGFLAGFGCLVLLVVLLSRSSMRAGKPLKFLQWAMTGLLAFGHGANDPQKSMGVMMLAIHSMGGTATEIPLLVRVSTGIAIGTGILSLAPGIVKRVGGKIYKLRNVHAAAVEMASAFVVVGGSITGAPVAASQVISSSVVGVGTAVRPKRLGWLVVRDMLIAWCLTIPCSGMLACGLHLLGYQIFNFITTWK